MDAAGTSRLPNAQITHVISSRSNVKGLERAASHSPPISSQVCALKTFLNKVPGSSREDYDREVARRVVETRPDLVVLAGWMHILSPAFLAIIEGDLTPPACPPGLPSSITNPSSEVTTGTSCRFPIPIINLHPALPGEFDGANAIGRAYEAFQAGQISRTGVMVHKVVAQVDAGKPLVVRKVEIKLGDSLNDLETRMHEVRVPHGHDQKREREGRSSIYKRFRHRWNTKSSSTELESFSSPCHDSIAN
jgi:phosphoribosylglycinamide formyltransferase